MISHYFQSLMADLKSWPTQTAFDDEEYEARLSKLLVAMDAADIETVLLSSPESMCWLHGYTLRWYKAHASRQWPPLQCTAVNLDSRSFIHFDQEGHRAILALTSVARDLCLTRNRSLDSMLPFIVEELQKRGWLSGRVGIDRWSYIPNPAVSDAMKDAFEHAGSSVVDATSIVREVRRIKSDAELRTIRMAVEVCDVGLEALRAKLRPGMTELEAWAVMERAMIDAGGEPAAMHECVVAGPNVRGHSYSTHRRIGREDFVLTDPCGVVNRYHGNVSRTLFFKTPPPEAIRIAEIQAGAFDVLRKTAMVGTPVQRTNEALREYYRDEGVWEMNAFLGGYELGLSFPPDWVGDWLFSASQEDNDQIFERNMVTNFESNVLFMLIDTVVYTDAGVETLSRLPLDLMVI